MFVQNFIELRAAVHEKQRNKEQRRCWKQYTVVSTAVSNESLVTDHKSLGVEKELCDDGWQPALAVDVVYHAQRQRLDRSEHLQESSTAKQRTLPVQIHDPRTNLSQKRPRVT